MNFKSLSKHLLIKSLAFFCVFILLTVSILSSHGSALPDSNDSSGLFSDSIKNIGGDIKNREEKSNDCKVREYENGSSIINCLVDVNDANDDYADFDYSEFVNCTNPDSSDTDSDSIPDNIEIVNRNINPSQYNPNIQDSLPPEVKNVKVSMDEHWTSVTVTIIPSVVVYGVVITNAVTASVSIIDGISIRVTADVYDASGVYDVTFKKGSTVVDGLLVSGNTFNAGFFLGISLGSLIKLVSDITVGFTVKVKAYDYIGNWNESEGSYDGPFTVLANIAVTILAAAWNALCAVAEAVVEALNTLVSWIWDVITNMINAVVQPIIDAINNWMAGLVKILEDNFEADSPVKVIGDYMEVVNAIFDYMLIPFVIIGTLVVVAQAIEVIIKVLSAGVSDILARVVQFAAPLFIIGGSMALAGAIYLSFDTGINTIFIEQLGDAGEYIKGFAATQAAYFTLLSKLLVTSTVLSAMALGLLSIFVSIFPKGPIWWVNLLLDALAIAIGVLAVRDYVLGPDETLAKVLTPFVSTITGIIAYSSIVTATSTLISDMYNGIILPSEEG